MKKTLNAKEKSVLDLVCRDSDAAFYFFRDAKNIKWYDPLTEKGFFKVEHIPEREFHSDNTWSVNRWMVLPYLLECAKRVRENETGLHEYGSKLTKLICDITNDAERSEKINNYNVGWYFVMIMQELPIEFFSEEVARSIQIWVKNTATLGTNMIHDIAMELLPKVLKAEKLTVISILFEILLKDCLLQYDKYYIEIEWIKTFFEQYGDLVAKKSFATVKQLIDEAVEKTLEKEYNGGPHQSLFAIAKTKIQGIDFFAIVFLIMKTLLLELYKHNKKLFEEMLVDYLGQKYRFFNKIGLYVLAQISDINSLFFEIMESQKEVRENAFLSMWNEGELKEVLQSIKPLSLLQQNKLIKYIEYESNETEYSMEEWKERRYGEFLEIDVFRKKYEECKAVVGQDSRLHDIVMIAKPRWGSISPVSIEEILAMDNNILVKKLVTFRAVRSWDMPTECGFGEALKEAVKRRPNKFLIDIHLFLKLNYLYIVEMFYGFDASVDSKSLNWEILINFMQLYIEQEGFWESKRAVQGIGNSMVDAEDVVKVIGNILSKGCSIKGEKSIPNMLFSKIEDILYCFFEHRCEFVHEESTAFDYVYNNTNGMVLRVFLEQLLHIKESQKLVTRAWKCFSIALQEKREEMYALFGYYLPQFYYINKKWSQEKIVELRMQKDSPVWTIFMAGYYSQANGYQEIINDLSDFYESSLNGDLLGVEREAINSHIAMLYTYDLIKNHGARRLFFNYISVANEEKLLSMVQYMLDIEMPEYNIEIKNRIFDFWKYINEQKEMPGSVLYKALGFVKYKESFDKQTLSWMKRAAKYSEVSGGLYWLAQVFKSMLEKNREGDSSIIEYIIEIFYEAVKAREKIIFYENEWLDIMKTLVRKSGNSSLHMDKLRDINNICLKHGQTIFKDLVPNPKI